MCDARDLCLKHRYSAAMLRFFFILSGVLMGLLLVACQHPIYTTALPPQMLMPQPDVQNDGAEVPVSQLHSRDIALAENTVKPSYHLSSPFFLGVRADDLAWAQAQAKPSLLKHWHIMGERSTWVRERVLKGLDDANAPHDLQVIPIVESAYKPYALSRTGAMGLWQLMPQTAHGLGVRNTRGSDGRRHVEISTRAAAQYLMQQRQKFGNWVLAFAAYNMGPYGLARRLKKTPWKLSDGIRNLPVPNETQAYVARILGVTALLHLHVLSFPRELETSKVTLQPPIDIRILEKNLKLSKNTLFRLNPQLHYSQYFRQPISIHIPNTLLESLPEASKQQRPHYIHVRIRSGDSLWQLARTYHTSTNRLKSLNPKLSKTLHIGQRIKVPAHGYGRATANLNPLLSQGRRIRYKVRKGDSLWSISHRFGTTTHAIARSNQLSKKHVIRPGDTLWILARIRSS